MCAAVKDLVGSFDPLNDILICGHAVGVDTLAEYRWMDELQGIGFIFPAMWHTHGKQAGPIRNARMLTQGKPDIVCAFPAADSIGTLDMMKKARRVGIPVRLYK